MLQVIKRMGKRWHIKRTEDATLLYMRDRLVHLWLLYSEGGSRAETKEKVELAETKLAVRSAL